MEWSAKRNMYVLNVYLERIYTHEQGGNYLKTYTIFILVCKIYMHTHKYVSEGIFVEI